jgi:hypothetical protein
VSGIADPCVFDLVDLHENLLFVQTPSTAPDVRSLCAPGQRLAALSDRPPHWAEFTYRREGQAWRQRHGVVRLRERFAVLTLQGSDETFHYALNTFNNLLGALQPGTAV